MVYTRAAMLNTGQVKQLYMKIKEEIKALQKVHEKLNGKLSDLNDKVELRTEVADNKSDTWQDSDKGMEYIDLTEEMESDSEALADKIEELGTLIEEFEELCS